MGIVGEIKFACIKMGPLYLATSISHPFTNKLQLFKYWYLEKYTGFSSNLFIFSYLQWFITKYQNIDSNQKRGRDF